MAISFRGHSEMIREEIAIMILKELLNEIGSAPTHADVVIRIMRWIEYILKSAGVHPLENSQHRGMCNYSGSMARLHEISRVLKRVNELGEAMAAGTLLEERKSYVDQTSTVEARDAEGTRRYDPTGHFNPLDYLNKYYR